MKEKYGRPPSTYRTHPAKTGKAFGRLPLTADDLADFSTQQNERQPSNISRARRKISPGFIQSNLISLPKPTRSDTKKELSRLQLKERRGLRKAGKMQKGSNLTSILMTSS